MKKSELKEIIKSQFLAEAEDSKKGNSEEQKRMEGAIRDDRDHIKNLEKDIKDNEEKLAKLKKDFKDDVNEAEDVDVEDNEDIDVEDNEDVNVDIEDDVNIDDESSKSEIEVAAILGLLTKAQSEAKALGDEKLMDQIGNTITYYTRAHVVATNEEQGMDPERFVGSGGDEIDSDSIVNVTKDNPAEDAEIGFALDESLSRFSKLAGLIK
jgi:hypothetical protein